MFFCKYKVLQVSENQYMACIRAVAGWAYIYEKCYGGYAYNYFGNKTDEEDLMDRDTEKTIRGALKRIVALLEQPKKTKNWFESCPVVGKYKTIEEIKEILSNEA